MKILIVDDDEITRDMLKSLLQQEGHEVLEAGDGLEALELLKNDGYGLVISDWEMPRMNGLELCRAIRGRSFARYIYTILLTHHGHPDDIVSGLSAGADDFMTKPFNPPELLARLRAGERVLSLESRELLIFALAKLVESRDNESGAHLDRIRNYCRLLAQELSRDPSYYKVIDDEYVNLIYLTSPLHDIGKITLPDTVLMKGGRLNDMEFSIMKSHAMRGAETMEAAMRQHPEAKFLVMARDIAAAHHERYNGSGYPLALAGEKIPLAARIVALADVYDALVTQRSYRDSCSHDVAASIIRDESGRYFDPKIVEAFLSVADQFAKIHDLYPEPAAKPPKAVVAQPAGAGR